MLVLQNFLQQSFFASVYMSSQYLRDVIQGLEALGIGQEVSVIIKENIKRVTFEHARGRHWYFEYELEMVLGSIILPGQKHETFVKMHHLNALKKASFLVENPLLLLLSEPEQHVLTQFGWLDLGNLAFMYQSGLNEENVSCTEETEMETD